MNANNHEGGQLPNKKTNKKVNHSQYSSNDMGAGGREGGGIQMIK